MRKPFIVAGALAVVAVTCATPRLSDSPSPLREKIAESVIVLSDTSVALLFPPPYVYLMWDAQIEECSGHKNYRDRDIFFVSQHAPLAIKGDTATWALHIAARLGGSHKVILSLGTEDDAYIVRHEHLHHVYPLVVDDPKTRTIDEAHPDSIFGPLAPCWRYIHDPRDDQ